MNYEIPLGLKEYIVNKTSEFNPYISGGTYKKYFNRECNLALATLLITGLSPYPEYPELLAPSGIMAIDIVIRAINGNHGDVQVAGLVGLIREIYDR